jgi:hypothetical protein
MATTTNYGWTTPDDTALVKDGAAAIRTLGSSIDTSLNTALGTKKAGLVLLNTTSFSGVTSQQINSVFSSTYDNYKIYLNITSGAGGSLAVQFATGGTANTTTNYNNVTWLFRSGNAAAVDTANESAASIAIISALNSGESADLTIFNPFASQYTHVTGSISAIAGAGYKAMALTHAGNFLATTSFDGIKFNFSTSHTGTVSIYGVNK